MIWRRRRHTAAYLYIENALGSDLIYGAIRDWVGFQAGVPYRMYKADAAKLLFGYLYTDWFRQTFKLKMDLVALPVSDFEMNPYFSDGLYYQVRFKPQELHDLRLKIYGEYQMEFGEYLETCIARQKANELRSERFCLATYGECRGNPDARGEALLAFLAELSAPIWWEWFEENGADLAARFDLKI